MKELTKEQAIKLVKESGVQLGAYLDKATGKKELAIISIFGDILFPLDRKEKRKNLNLDEFFYHMLLAENLRVLGFPKFLKLAQAIITAID